MYCPFIFILSYNHSEELSATATPLINAMLHININMFFLNFIQNNSA